MSEFTVHVLGCGSAKPTLRHQPSCTVLEHHDNLYMIDCGEGAQLSFLRQGLRQSRLRHVFLTHLHGDHVFGLLGLTGTLALHAKGGELTIHTFEDGKRILETVNSYFNRDTPFQINFNILDPKKEEIAYENEKLRVRTVPLRHRVDCVGYVFEEKEKERHLRKDMCDFHQVPISLYKDLKRGADLIKPDGTVICNEMLTTAPTPGLSYAHLGDTAYFPELAGMVGKVDLMYHETTYLDAHAELAAKRGHSTAKEAARTALESGSRWLLTGHYSSRYKEKEKIFAEEAREIFPNVIAGNEQIRIDCTKLR